MHVRQTIGAGFTDQPMREAFVTAMKTTSSNVLWSAREAAQKLGYAPRTAQRIAKAHFEAGDPNIIAVSKSFVASPEWWKEVDRKSVV